MVRQRPLPTPPKPRIPPPLVGKALPDLKALGIDLPPADTDGTMILVCFFDKDQRPSRYCLQQLSKRAQELKAKRVVVVAIQASKQEQAKLDEWLKEDNIPFPVGMIQGDEDKFRFNWGVQSLPWLILTDHKGVVRAEAFAVSELDQTVRLVTHAKEKKP
jgi:peroxiredoxin